MELGERFLRYRAKHGISQSKLANLLEESMYVVRVVEGGLRKPHKASMLRFETKMDELERKDKQHDEVL